MSESNQLYIIKYGPIGVTVANNLTPIVTTGPFNQVYIINYNNGTALAAGLTNALSIRNISPCILNMTAAVANTLIRIRDASGVSLAFTSTLLPSIALPLAANTAYVISVANNTGSAITNNTTLISNINVTNTPVVSQYFSSGFQNQATLGSTISLAVDSYGQPTYTLTNYPLVAGSPLTLTWALFAKSAVTVNGTVTTAQPGYIQSIVSDVDNAGGSFYGIMNVTQSGLWTGTIAFTIPGVGTPAQQNFAMVTSSD